MVRRRPEMASASYSRLISYIDYISRASTAFGVPQPGSQYSSTAELALNPVQFSTLEM